ncbi:MAG: hypothetical protein ACYDCI_11965 [Candidatus Limnocylindrales bacterium]
MVAERGRRPATSGSRIRVVLVAPDGLDVGAPASDTGVMDPLVIALAALVTDRWTREQAERAAARARLRIVRKGTA